MRISFFGAATEVGRSCIMVESSNAKVLLDAGVKIGKKDEYPLLSDDELRDVDAVIVSHAHLDHCGYLPHIYSSSYSNFTYATKPTFELVNILASDYIKISNPENVSREGLSRMQKHFKIVEYHKDFKIKDLDIKLVPAGHILGSAMIEVKSQSKRLLYTGDINFRTTKLLNAGYTESLTADTLITESTYGGDKDSFPPDRTVLSNMAKSIKETIQASGKIIIPSFGVGRAQEILLTLDDYMRSGALPKVPIYTDGMVNKAMRIHRHNVVYCRDELQKRILLNDDDPFKSENFVPVATSQQRRKIISEHEPGIIVTTSGMLSGGPVLKYIERMAGDPKNKVIIVGYQAEGTRGRELVDGATRLNLGHKEVAIKLLVQKFHLSAHADRPQILQFISKVKNLRNIFVVHGEVQKSHELSHALGKKYSARVPELRSSFDI